MYHLGSNNKLVKKCNLYSVDGLVAFVAYAVDNYFSELNPQNNVTHVPVLSFAAACPLSVLQSQLHTAVAAVCPLSFEKNALHDVLYHELCACSASALFLERFPSSSTSRFTFSPPQ